MDLQPKVKEAIEAKILDGQRIKEIFNYEDPIDLYIIERLAFYRYVIPLQKKLGHNFLSEDNYNNCIIQMYVDLKDAGRIAIPAHKRIEYNDPLLPQV